jgi:predicted transcriptional regulator
MTLREIATLLNAQTLCEEADLDREVETCFAADLMSDVLAFCPPKTLLITGLATHQSIHTATVADLLGIVYIRGKQPDEPVLNRARAQQIPLLITDKHMFETCTILAHAGVKGLNQ